ncbi:hypothetical protein EJB05_23040, partial [Eragrostis curvula]
MDRLAAMRALHSQVRDDEIVSVASSPATLVDAAAAASEHSGSRNRKEASEGRNDVAKHLVPESPADSMTNIPQGALSDSEMEEDEEPLKCRHEEPVVRKYCWDGADTGRYLPKPVQIVLLTMWDVVRQYEEMANKALQEKDAAVAALRASEERASRLLDWVMVMLLLLLAIALTFSMSVGMDIGALSHFVLANIHLSVLSCSVLIL